MYQGSENRVSENQIKLVLCLIGMSGAKKTLLAEKLRMLGYHVCELSHYLRRELEKRELEPSPHNFQMIAKELRELHGQAVLAKIAINDFDSKVLIVDGVRSMSEIEVFRANSECVVIIAVCSSPKSRYNRILSKKQPYLLRENQVVEIDNVNLELGLGNLIAMADYYIINEDYIGFDIYQQLERLVSILKRDFSILME